MRKYSIKKFRNFCFFLLYFFFRKRPSDTNILPEINFRSLQEFRQLMKRAHIGISAQFYVCGNKKRCRFCDAEDNYLKEQFEQDPSLTKIKPYYRDKTWSINMSTDGQKAHLYKYHQNEIKGTFRDVFRVDKNWPAHA